MSKTPRTVELRITDYLFSGGLFNPELANHDAVRDLLIDARDALAAERERADRNQEDAGRWIRLCELWCASTELALMQEDDGRWSIKQVEDVEGETFYQLFGDTPDAAIDAARGKE
jgi:hypothetical protein